MKYIFLTLLLALSFMAQSQSDSLNTQPTQAARPMRPLPPYQPGVALMVSAGTTGIGGGIGYSFSRQLAVRVGATMFNYAGTAKTGKDGDNVQIGFNYKAKLQSASIMADVYPFKQAGFRLTGGAFYNLNELTFFGKSTKDVSFNDVKFTADEVGTFDGKATFNKFAPYVGLGWGNPYTRHRLKFMFDLGFFYQQSPLVNLSATGMLEPSSDQGTVIANNLKALKYYPVVSFGLSYKL